MQWVTTSAGTVAAVRACDDGVVNRLARDLWRVIEPYHQLAYRSPEATAAYEQLGLRRADLAYFGNRLAALGPVGPKVAVAVLYGFAPGYVAGAIPEVWHMADARSIVEARANAAHATLLRVLGDVAHTADMQRAAQVARALVDATDLAGRPLAAAQAELEWPTEAAMVLWQACTVLREHRGDAHWAATSAAAVGPVECHVLHAADGAMPAELLQRVSGWSDDAWAGAVESLRQRDLLHVQGGLTDAGHTVKLRIERATDAAAAQALAAVGAHEVEWLRSTMAPWVVRIMEAGVVGAWTLREQLWRDLPLGS